MIDRAWSYTLALKSSALKNHQVLPTVYILSIWGENWFFMFLSSCIRLVFQLQRAEQDQCCLVIIAKTRVWAEWGIEGPNGILQMLRDKSSCCCTLAAYIAIWESETECNGKDSEGVEACSPVKRVLIWKWGNWCCFLSAWSESARM